MEIALGILLLVCYLVGATGAIWLMIEAFKVSTTDGMLAFFAPYTLYFGFAKLRHPRKSLILGMWLGGLFVGVIVNVILASLYD